MSNPRPKYIPEFISIEEEENLLQLFNSKEWDTTLQRKTQHYGWRYPYKTKDRLEKTNPIPQEIQPLLQRLNQTFGKNFDQLIVNEYQPGQGIAPHIDHPELFGDTILSLSLGSDCVMKFYYGEKGDDFEVLLSRRSLVALQNEIRWKYLHSIPARKKDNGKVRGVRISLTFREINKDNLI